MKKLLSFTLFILMIIGVAGCCAPSDKEKAPEVNKAETYVETKAEEIITNKAILKYSGAIKYNPFNDENFQPKLVVYIDFTNKSDKNIKPIDVISMSAVQGKKALKQYEFKKEYSAAEYDNITKVCKPNETVTFCSYWTFDDDGSIVVFKISEKNNKSQFVTTFDIETSKLDLAKQTLNTEVATETE